MLCCSEFKLEMVNTRLTNEYQVLKKNLAECWFQCELEDKCKAITNFHDNCYLFKEGYKKMTEHDYLTYIKTNNTKGILSKDFN